ncbi:TPA: hypothetical protein ACXRW7_004129 [Klebsiella quasipneumoniae subsp. quasipneumoniae]|uniref:hypothetical protein n=1 Tax=Klebsiella sp. 1SOBk5mer TaxID=3391013 RepID=UPI0039835A08
MLSPQGNGQTEKQKACSKAGFLNLAPLTGIAFAINWLIDKLNLKSGGVKTTRMPTIFFWFFLSERKPRIMVGTPPHLCFPSNQIKRKKLR